MLEPSPQAVSARLSETPTPLDILRRSARERPGHPAIVYLPTPGERTPRTVTYRQLLGQAEAAVRALRRAGIGEGDAIAILLPPIPETAVALVAAMAMGTAFPVNLLFSAEAMAAQLRLAGARAAIVLGPHPAMDVHTRLVAAAQQVPGLTTIVEVPAGHGSGGGIAWADFINSGRPRLFGPKVTSAGAPDRVGALFHTGGTTGEPKLAELTVGGVAAGAVMTAAGCGWRPTDRTISGLPLFHVAGAIDALLGTFVVGATVVFPSLLGARDPEFVRQVWSVTERTKATLLGLVPTSIAAVSDVPIGKAKLKALRAVVTGGSALSPQLAQRFERMVGVPVCQIYGMTEMSGIISAQPFDGAFREPAVGFPVPGLGFRLSDSGEVEVSGPNLFRGYRTPSGPIAAPADGWVASGDLGEQTTDGQLRLRGRSKDVIIRSGHNIDPALIEEAAQAHPDVRQTGAVPMPDAYAGELPVLYVALAPGSAATAEEIGAFVAERIAEPPARPKQVFVLPELPLTPLGKIARYKLRQAAAEHRSREALDGLPAASVACADTAGKAITVGWAEGAAAEHRDLATARLGELGLTLAP